MLPNEEREVGQYASWSFVIDIVEILSPCSNAMRNEKSKRMKKEKIKYEIKK